jgi:hypothetical protein
MAIMLRVIRHSLILEHTDRRFFIRDELEMLESDHGRTRVSDRMLRFMPQSIIDDWPHPIEIGLLSQWVHPPD